jgi:predicted GH43/DUF377 family glycosyl hydrolase
VTNQISSVPVCRRFGGVPIIAPTERSWENGVTFNAAVTFVPQTPANQTLLTRLLAGTVYHNSDSRDGLIAVHYRSRPKSDPGYLITRSYVGLALFTPSLELIYRFPEPCVFPDDDKAGPDYLGVEDPRITRFGDTFVMVYCGSGLDEEGAWRGTMCTAESTDLLLWTKRGPMDLRYRTGAGRFDDTYFDNLRGATGTARHVNNKDGVLFEGRIDGWHYLLHRPMVGRISDWAIHLARSRSLDGAWTDLGPILRARPHADYEDAWVGAGAVPIEVGGGRFLEIYHSGHRAADGSRLYTLGAALFDFNRLDPARPASIVESRLDHFMAPETKWEIEGPYENSVGNVLFTCGAYAMNDEIYMLYTGGDTFVMAATMKKADLLAGLVPAGVDEPL